MRGPTWIRVSFLFPFLLSWAPLSGASPAPARQNEACAWFRDRLDSVPHEMLRVESGALESLYTGEEIRGGCQVRFRTRPRPDGAGILDLTAAEGSDLYRMGWRMDETVAADGPGTSLFGILRDGLSCLIYEAQPAFLDDAGEVVQSEILEITIQCRRR